MEIIEIKGIQYIVVQSRTVQETVEAGLGNIARIMVKNNATRRLVLRRINGKRHYICNEFSTKKGLTYGNVFPWA